MFFPITERIFVAVNGILVVVWSNAQIDTSTLRIEIRQSGMHPPSIRYWPTVDTVEFPSGGPPFVLDGWAFGLNPPADRLTENFAFGDEDGFDQRIRKVA